MKFMFALSICLLNVTAHAAEVVTYPAPEEETRQLAPYEVWVGDQRVDVYAARTLDAPFAEKEWDYGGTYYFANFDMSGPVLVRVTSPRDLRKTFVRPDSLGIVTTVTDAHTLTFTLERPRKLSIEPEGKKSPLLLFANPIEESPPSANDPDVKYYGPGVHKPEKIELHSNQTLYLAGGAVVQAEVLIRGENVRILGRGILDGSPWAWRSGPVGSLIAIRNSNNVEVCDVTLRGSSHWTIVPFGSQGVTIRNVKICNSRVQNDDGINPCNSQDVLITDCFIRSDDDCVALKGLELDVPNNNVERITIENSTLWCDRARIFLLGHESRAQYMRNVTIRNVDIIHFTMTAFLFEPGEEMRLEDVTVKDVRIHGEGQASLIRLQPVVNQYMRNKVPGHVANIRFERVTVTGEEGKYLVQLQGGDAQHVVNGVQFDGVSILGAPLDEKSSHIQMGPSVDNVQFTP
ncbi:MAG: glycosyl hydrolase family 28 protein [Pirellulaceae bacterium]